MSALIGLQVRHGKYMLLLVIVGLSHQYRRVENGQEETVASLQKTACQI